MSALYIYGEEAGSRQNHRQNPTPGTSQSVGYIITLAGGRRGRHLPLVLSIGLRHDRNTVLSPERMRKKKRKASEQRQNVSMGRRSVRENNAAKG